MDQKPQRHARTSGHPDSAAGSAALDSRFRGNDITLNDALHYGSFTSLKIGITVYPCLKPVTLLFDAASQNQPGVNSGTW